MWIVHVVANVWYDHQKSKYLKSDKNIIIKRKCPFCKSVITDILEHIRIAHDIDSVEEFNEKMAKLEIHKANQEAFQKYVQELQEMEKKGSISTEDYRRLITEWIKQH